MGIDLPLRKIGRGCSGIPWRVCGRKSERLWKDARWWLRRRVKEIPVTRLRRSGWCFVKRGHWRGWTRGTQGADARFVVSVLRDNKRFRVCGSNLAAHTEPHKRKGTRTDMAVFRCICGCERVCLSVKKSILWWGFSWNDAPFFSLSTFQICSSLINIPTKSGATVSGARSKIPEMLSWAYCIYSKNRRNAKPRKTSEESPSKYEKNIDVKYTFVTRSKTQEKNQFFLFTRDATCALGILVLSHKFQPHEHPAIRPWHTLHMFSHKYTHIYTIMIVVIIA